MVKITLLNSFHYETMLHTEVVLIFSHAFFKVPGSQ